MWVNSISTNNNMVVWTSIRYFITLINTVTKWNSTARCIKALYTYEICIKLAKCEPVLTFALSRIHAQYQGFNKILLRWIYPSFSHTVVFSTSQLHTTTDTQIIQKHNTQHNNTAKVPDFLHSHIPESHLAPKQNPKYAVETKNPQADPNISIQC